MLKVIDINPNVPLRPFPPSSKAPMSRRPPARKGWRLGDGVGSRTDENAAIVPRKPRILVVKGNSLPVPPANSPRPQLAFRARRLRDAPLAVSAMLVQKASAVDLMMLRSRSLSALTTVRAMAIALPLPKNAIQRARSAPALRGCVGLLRGSAHGSAERAVSLGASLRYSSGAAFGMPRKTAGHEGMRVPAARFYFDPATGCSIALRCSEAAS